MSRQLWRWLLCLVCCGSVVPVVRAADGMPKVVDPRLKIELFAEHPQIVTPTGIDIDPQGRIWAIESNTHFPPEGYQGHPTDRLLVMQDTNGDGRADDIKVFADGLIHSMSVAIRPLWFPVAGKGDLPPPKLSVYVATRKEVLLLHDDDGDLKADRRERLVHLDTKGDYPHDGLAGLSFDALGNLFIGFGENLGADYKIIGSDGKSLAGGNEGGNIYRCRLDGTQLTHWATGFWNPHANCVDAFGRMFSIDNDADSRPPCRLLHIIPGGDYGYRYRNGRKGLHPFTAWNGEIPGTLPMVAGTGEAPSGIVSYDSDGLPEDYRGNLLIGSWGDHRIDRFKLVTKDSSFTSLAEPIVVGDENFRPVGLAVAPDGSLYFTDWVLREYKLHSKGRIWRISSAAPRTAPVVTLESLRQASTVDLYGALSSPVGPVRRMAAFLLSHSEDGLQLLISQIADRAQSSPSRLEAFWAAANVATQANPPTKLLLILRSLAAAKSLGASGTGTFGTTGRRIDPVTSATVWLASDATVSRNPVIDNLLSLLPTPNTSTGRGFGMDEPVFDLAQTALAIRQPISANDILPSRLNGDWSSSRGGSGRSSLADPFLLSLTVDRLAKVESLEQFHKWWEIWQTPELVSGRPQVSSDPSTGAIIRRVDVPRVDQMRYARTALVLAARRKFPKELGLLKTFLSDSEPLVRRLALQWVAELRLNELRPEVEANLKNDTLDSDLFLTTLAALEMLDGKSPVEFDQTPAGKYVLPLVTKDGPPTVRRLALKLVSPNDPALTKELYTQLLSSPDPALHLEAIRTLQMSSVSGVRDLLLSVITDARQPLIDQAEAVTGLASAAKVDAVDSPVRKLLDKLVLGDNPTLQIEALRALRGTSTAQPSEAIQQLAETLKRESNGAANLSLELLEQLKLAWGEAKPPLGIDSSIINRPTNPQEWYAFAGLDRLPFGAGVSVAPQFGTPGGRGGNAGNPDASGPGRRSQFGNPGGGGRNRNSGNPIVADAAAGRRTFFHINSAGCSKCHTIDGRGGKVGPDLTTIARTMDRTKLAQSILEPSREMSPQFVAWSFELKTGKVLTGTILSEESEKLKIGTQDGQIHDLTLNEIETRVPQSVSLMPDKLIDQLTQQEFLDLLAFLETLK